MRPEADVGGGLFSRRCFLSEFVQHSRLGHVRFRVGGVEARGFTKFSQSFIQPLKVFKDGSKLEVRLRE